jgi:hypothetical protein
MNMPPPPIMAGIALAVIAGVCFLWRALKRRKKPEN